MRSSDLLVALALTLSACDGDPVTSVSTDSGAPDAPLPDRQAPLDVATALDVPPAIDATIPIDVRTAIDAVDDIPVRTDALVAIDVPPSVDVPTPPVDVPVAPDVPPVELRCGSLPYDTDALFRESVGFGRAARGGSPTRVVHVTTTADSGAGSLRAALESDTSQWVVFDIGASARATITLRSTLRARSNKTIDGRGRDVVINGTVEFRSAHNIVVTDLGFTNNTAARCTQDGDVLSMRGPGATRPEDFETRDIWLNHLVVFDGGDGLLDIRGGSRITVSWSHFHTHEKGMLFSMESAGAIEGREMEVTLHHNFFDRITRRGPQVSHGRVHFFNNYQFEWWEFGAASLVGAQFASEANVYEARPGATCGLPFVGCRDPNPCGDSDFEVSKIAVSNNWSTSNRGYISSVGDLLLDDARVEVNEPARVFRPTDRYPYTAEAASPALAARIRAESGPRTRYCR